MPIRAIEQLANLEVRLGGVNDDPKLIEAGLRRLRSLTDLMLSRPIAAAETPAEPEAAGEQACPAEWWALIGSGEKRRAALRARAVIQKFQPEDHAAMVEAIKASIEAYARVQAEPHHLLNTPTLQAILAMPKPAEPAVIRMITTLHDDLRRGFEREGTFWAGMLQADALLALHLSSGALAPGPDEAGKRVAAEVMEAYRAIFRSCHANPLEQDSALDNLRLLAQLLRALACSGRDPEPHGSMAAERLEWIQRSLRESLRSPAAPEAQSEAAVAVVAEDGVRLVGE